MHPVILTMVLIFYGNGVPTTTATVKTEYPTVATCEAAKKTNAAALTEGKVVLATCTQA